MYIPLSIKTNFSLLSSLIDIDSLIEYAKEKNIKSLAITDDNMFGMMNFYKACRNNDIKPIIGLEIKLENDYLFLYAKDYSGYQSLIKLSTIQSERLVTIQDVLDNNNGLGRIGYVQECSLQAFAEHVKKQLRADYIVIGDAGRAVHKVAVCGGAGSDLIEEALHQQADTLLTGDVKYHDAQRAVFSGLNIIDAGHQCTEWPILENWADRLSLRFTEKDWNITLKVAKEELLLKHV